MSKYNLEDLKESNFSYDYEEFINEIFDELLNGSLELTHDIQILRKSINFDYEPIIDWYYSHDKMKELVETDPFDNARDIVQKEDIWNGYLSDKENLETISVRELLNEMKILNSIFYSNTKLIDYIKQKMLENNLNQTQTASALELSRNQFLKILSGEIAPSYKTLKKLSEVFCIKLEKLISFEI